LVKFLNLSLQKTKTKTALCKISLKIIVKLAAKLLHILKFKSEVQVERLNKKNELFSTEIKEQH